MVEGSPPQLFEVSRVTRPILPVCRAAPSDGFARMSGALTEEHHRRGSPPGLWIQVHPQKWGRDPIFFMN